MEINPLKYLTAKRLLNIVKVVASYQLSNFLHKPVVWGMPVSYSIEPTNHCNLKCPECPSGLGALTRPLGLMKFQTFKNIVDQIKDTGFYIQLYFQGEPFINKELFSMIDYARENKIYTSISTNGILLKKETVNKILESPPDKIIFSIDGLDEETYQNYRYGGTFKEADEGLRLLLSEKKKRKLKIPYVEFQFIVMKQNEHQVDEVKRYGKKIGVDKVTLKTMQVTSLENAKYFLPENPQYSRYKIENGKLILKNKLKNKCFALWRTSVITWDGRVVPCCFDKDAKYELGKLNGKNFEEIWKNGNFHLFRKQILKNRKAVDICRNCTEGMKINIFEIE